MNELRIKRIYLSPEKMMDIGSSSTAVWPRGISKVKASLAEWDKTVAPSTELREWFGHEDEKFAESNESTVLNLIIILMRHNLLSMLRISSIQAM